MADTPKNLTSFTLTAAPGLSGTFAVGVALPGCVLLGSGDNTKTFSLRAQEPTGAFEVRTGCVYTHSTRSLSRGTLDESSTGSAIALTPGAVVTVTVAADWVADVDVALAAVADAPADIAALEATAPTAPQKTALAAMTTANLQAITAAEAVALRGLAVSSGQFLGATNFYSFGDSISYDGGRIINASASADVNVYQYSWQKFAQFSAGEGAMYWAGTFGLGGQTVAQLRATYLPLLLAHAPLGSVVVVLMGQNDLGGITAQTFADYRHCVESMIDKGLTPVLGTLTPGTNSRTWHALNTFVLVLAAEKKLELIDFHAATVDPATGLWQAALTRDGVHPNQAGAKAMGLAAGATLSRLSGRRGTPKWLAQHSVDFGPNRTTQTGGNANPLFATDNAASPPIPTGWGINTGSHAGAIAFASATVGRKMTLTQPAGGADLTVRNSSANTVVAGDVCVLAFWLTTTVKATGAFLRFGVLNGSGQALADFGASNSQGGAEDVPRSLILVPFTHSGTTGVLVDFKFGLGSGGASAVIEQFTLLNLTAMGLA